MKVTLWALYSAFFRVGLFTLGGGYSMLPMLIKEVVEKHGWATEDELVDYFAISQTSPGTIAVNTATFVGTRHRGIPGALFAMLGVVSPSWFCIALIATFFGKISDYPVVKQAFSGIRVVVLALIIHSLIRMIRKALTGMKDYTVLFLSLILVASGLLPTVAVIIGSGLISIGAMFFKEVNRNEPS